ncbi:MAG TPA: HAMP domain-containing sensor histidine kinase [Longimicrobiales bacterium]
MIVRGETQTESRPRAALATGDPSAEFVERARAHVREPLEQLRALLADARAGEIGPDDMTSVLDAAQHLVDRIDGIEHSLDGVHLGPGPQLTLALASELSFIARHLESPLPAPTVERLQPRVRRAARLATLWLSPYDHTSTTTHGPAAATQAAWQTAEVPQPAPDADGNAAAAPVAEPHRPAREAAPAAPAPAPTHALLAHDILRERVAELRAERRMLAERLEILDRYWRFSTHELRNASQSLLMLLEQLEDSTVERAPWLEPLARATRTLMHRSQEALDDRAVAGGMFAVAPEPIDLVEVSLAVLEETRALAAHHNVRLVGERLPVGQPLWALADPGRVQQILHNLLRNALEATPDGGFVMLEAFGIDGYACVTVRDSGAGLDPHRAEELLALGERRAGAGTRAGLGLPICRHLAHAMGGWVRPCAQKPGLGAGFQLALPRYPQ